MARLVLDATPLSHFTQAGLLDLLAELLRGFDCVTTSPVLQELTKGAGGFPVLRDVSQLSRLTMVDCISLERFTCSRST